jgi:GNAT superfamily N-acetyltransferase
MTDPMDALNGLQAALNAGTVQLNPCDLYPEIRVILDHPNETPRFTYAQVKVNMVQAIALLVKTEPVQGLPCFQLGCAVIESLRGQGIGTRILQQAIDELINGLSRTPIKEFYLEAIVSNENVASNKIAKLLISDVPKPCKDVFSGEPAYQYLRKVKCGVAK